MMPKICTELEKVLSNNLPGISGSFVYIYISRTDVLRH